MSALPAAIPLVRASDITRHVRVELASDVRGTNLDIAGYQQMEVADYRLLCCCTVNCCIPASLLDAKSRSLAATRTTASCSRKRHEDARQAVWTPR